jgi:hypothetical protein
MSWANKVKVNDGSTQRANVLLPDGLHLGTIVNMSRPYVRVSQKYGASLRVSFQVWPDSQKKPNELLSYSVSIPTIKGTVLTDDTGEPLKNISDEWIDNHMGSIGSKSNLYMLLVMLGAMNVEERMVDGKKVPTQIPDIPSLIGKRVQIKTRSFQLKNGSQGCTIEQILPAPNVQPDHRKWVNPWENEGNGSAGEDEEETTQKPPANLASNVVGLVDTIREQSAAVRTKLSSEEHGSWLEQVQAMIASLDKSATKLATMNADAAFLLLAWLQTRAEAVEADVVPLEEMVWYNDFLAANGIVLPVTSEDDL